MLHRATVTALLTFLRHDRAHRRFVDVELKYVRAAVASGAFPGEHNSSPQHRSPRIIVSSASDLQHNLHYTATASYHDSEPWQAFEQRRLVAFHPVLATSSLTPLLCVAVVTVVEL
jgi:hypothetical protein